ncbi:MAG: sigma-70 family RNA polymerase sigma factor [Clostridia bacterium]|nr:sigma-70 family RNA polymerase sigma factor [Clostridia bacterium]
MDDSVITGLFLERSEGAVAALAEKYGGACRRLAFNITGSYEDAEEVVSDAYLAVWNSVPPERPEKLGAFVLRIVRNIAVSRSRANLADKRGRAVTAVYDELRDCVPSARSVEGELEAAQLMEELTRFIRGLRRDDRMLFVRRYWYLDPTSELAKEAGLSEAAVRARLSRMRKKLRKHLGSKGVEV